MKFKSAQRQHKICHTWRTPKRSFFTGTMKQKEQKHAWFSIFVGRTTMKLSICNDSRDGDEMGDKTFAIINIFANYFYKSYVVLMIFYIL